MSGTSKQQVKVPVITKKIPAHRKAIQEASSLTTASPGSTNNTPSNNKVTSTKQQKVAVKPIDPGSNNISLENLNINEDYETGKVLTARKSAKDEDIDAVKDLDKWAY